MVALSFRFDCEAVIHDAVAHRPTARLCQRPSLPAPCWFRPGASTSRSGWGRGDSGGDLDQGGRDPSAITAAGAMQAKSDALDDIIVVVMCGCGLTALEQTIMDSGQPERIIELREDFQRMMATADVIPGRTFPRAYTPTSRSPTPSWPQSTSPAMRSTASGTTPSAPQTINRRPLRTIANTRT
jgi:hypothetical protein